MAMSGTDHLVRWASPQEADGLPRIPGHRVGWFVDPEWRLASGAESELACRQPKCGKPAVAGLLRRYGSSTRRWWYCADHLYGRVIEDGAVLVLRLVRFSSGAH